MAKGFDRHQERKAQISLFGKNLVRRSGSSCELCGSGGSLEIYEIPPVPAEPDYDRCLFVCETCRDQLDNPKKIDADHWRCLNNTIWSETGAIQAISLRLLRKLSDEHSWAEELLDMVYPDPEVDELASEK